MSHPSGVNLLDNTSELALGVVLAPVTWVFGPVASLNVALTLAPALSALAMFLLLRRWVRWAPAAFVGGLLYGFSPLVLVSLSDAHLMLGWAVVPPLVVACVDELALPPAPRRRRRRPGPRPAARGAVLRGHRGAADPRHRRGARRPPPRVAYGLAAPGPVRAHARHALVGLGTAAATAVVAPGLADVVRPGRVRPTCRDGCGPPSTWDSRARRPGPTCGPRRLRPATPLFTHRVGGYQGPDPVGPVRRDRDGRGRRGRACWCGAGTGGSGSSGR